MSPGLDQVKDLVPDIWFCLFLVIKEHTIKNVSSHIQVLHVLSRNTNTTEQTKLNRLCLMTIREVGSPLFYLKTPSRHKAMTSSGSWKQCGLQEPESHGTGMCQSNFASSCCDAANSVMESRESVGKVKKLPAKIGPDHSSAHLTFYFSKVKTWSTDQTMNHQITSVCATAASVHLFQPHNLKCSNEATFCAMFLCNLLNNWFVAKHENIKTD